METASATLTAPPAPPGARPPALPLSIASYMLGVEFLLHHKSFSCDALLVGAEACDEHEHEMRCAGHAERAAAAADLARQLRAEAPHRPAAPLCRPSKLLDRAILIQASYRERGHPICDGEALALAHQQMQAETAGVSGAGKHVGGGAA